MTLFAQSTDAVTVLGIFVAGLVLSNIFLWGLFLFGTERATEAPEAGDYDLFALATKEELAPLLALPGRLDTFDQRMDDFGVRLTTIEHAAKSTELPPTSRPIVDGPNFEDDTPELGETPVPGFDG